MRTRTIDLDEALPQIQSVASVGRIVPFAGAGLSRPLCRGWIDFLDALSATVELDFKGPLTRRGADELYRAADRAAFALRLMREDIRRRAIVKALLDDTIPPVDRNIPSQAISLARGHWPLLITTNYDDVLLAALHEAGMSGARSTDDSIRMLGRSQQDCEQIVRSLDANQPPIIWHIQGFVDPVVPNHFGRVGCTCDRSALLDQIVIGHQQYQLAANRSPAFRRAFAEVYRRRSLLFIGSGLAESYFINLISEVTLNYGPSPQPHFALFSRAELDEIDTTFLQLRLGITSVCYGDTYDGLSAALDQISPATQYATALHVTRPLSVSYDVPRRNVTKPASLEFALRFSPLERPRARECIVLSVSLRHTPNGFVPHAGRRVVSFLKEYFASALASDETLHAKEVAPHLFRAHDGNQPLPVFFLAARDVVSDDVRRSLTAIGEWTAQALATIEELGEFDSVFMALIGAGRRSASIPIFSFLAQLSGFRRFAHDIAAPGRTGLRHVEVRTTDSSVIAPVVQGRIPIQELISSDRIRVFVRVSDASANSEAFTVNVSADDTVEDALRPYGLIGNGVRVDVSPLPYRQYRDPLRAPVFPTMTIEVKPGSI